MNRETDLRIKYAYYSWNYDFPDDIENALENDYIKNQEAYGYSTLDIIKASLLINPNLTADQALLIVMAQYD